MSETKEKAKEVKKDKCFVIMPISDQGDYPTGHFTKVYEQIIKPSIEETGYEAYRVDENNICDAIINKIFNAIQECPMAICDLSSRNPNVLYELGLRQAYDKPVVLIQDDKTDKIFDVSGISTVFYKSARLYEDVIEARENIKKAILATKEGKVSTLAKIMKVSVADFSEVEVSPNDKLNVILEGIYSEIRELKNKSEMKNLHPVVTGSTNSVIIFNDDSAIRVTITFTCNNQKKIAAFRDMVCENCTGLLSINIEQLPKNSWRMSFRFDKKASLEKIMKAISISAIEFGIKYETESINVSM